MVSGMERICAAPACAGTKRYVFQPRTKGRKDAQPEMAAVGEMTRWQHEQVKDDGCVRYSELVWQNGGHFTDVEKRIAHGFAWLIDHAQG